MDTKKSKVSSIIISNVLIEMLDDVIESEIDKGETLADFPYVDLMLEISDLLASLLEQASEGDTIYTLEVSRLARSTKQLCEIIEIVKEKKLRLVIVGSITVDCSNGQIDPMTNAFIQMSGVFAELKLRIIRARVKSAMANAKSKGVKLGRPQTTAEQIPQIFYRHYPSYKSGSLNLSEFARVCGLSRTTVYKYVSLLEN